MSAQQHLTQTFISCSSRCYSEKSSPGLLGARIPFRCRALTRMVSLVGILLMTPCAPAQIINGDFEDTSGPLVGWEAFGNVRTVDDVLEATSFPNGFADASTAENFTFLRLVNMADFAILQRCYDSSAAPCDVFDFNGDGQVQPVPDIESVYEVMTPPRAVLLEESQHGGLSRIRQTFTLPAGLPAADQRLAFEFRMFQRGKHGGSPVPPDSFTVHLSLDGSGMQRILLPTHAMPFFDFTRPVIDFDGRGYFYQDSDPNQPFNVSDQNNTGDAPVFDPDYVFLGQADDNGLQRVVFDLSEVPDGGLEPPWGGPEEVILEFGLASGQNNVDTFVIIDNVEMGCPVGFCCGTNGSPVPIPADPECGHYECSEDVDGYAEVTLVQRDIATLYGCCEGCLPGPTQAYDILFMVDVSGTTNQADLTASLAGINQLLDEWTLAKAENPAVIFPRVAVGKFASSAEMISANLSGFIAYDDDPQTDEFADLRTALTVGSTDFPVPTNGMTSVSEALRVAREFITSHSDAERMATVVLITDGWANEWVKEQYSQTDYPSLYSDSCPENCSGGSACCDCIGGIHETDITAPTGWNKGLEVGQGTDNSIFDDLKLDPAWTNDTGSPEFVRIHDGADQRWKDPGSDGGTYTVIAGYAHDDHYFGYVQDAGYINICDWPLDLEVRYEVLTDGPSGAFNAPVGSTFLWARTRDKNDSELLMTSLESDQDGLDQMVTYRIVGGTYDGQYIIAFDDRLATESGGTDSDYDDLVIRVSGVEPVMCDCWCDCAPAKLAAAIEANMLRIAGHEVFSIYYPGGGISQPCSDSDSVASTFLPLSISTTPLHFLRDSTGNGMPCVFEKLRARLACGDGDMCTFDFCKDDDCQHVLINNCPNTDIEIPAGTAPRLNIAYDVLTAAYDGVETFTMAGSIESTGGVVVNDTPLKRASFARGSLGGANTADITCSLTVSNITATTADGMGTLVMTDADGSTITAHVSGTFYLGAPPDSVSDTIFFQGSLSNVVYAFADSSFDGDTSNFTTSDFNTAASMGSLTVFEFFGNWFTSGAFSIINLQLDGSIHVPTEP